MSSDDGDTDPVVEPVDDRPPAGRDARPSAGDDARPADERAPNTVLNALIGAAVGVFLSFLPASPAVGGAVAGYLQGPDLREGARVGGIAAAMVVAAFAALALPLAALLFLGVVAEPSVAFLLFVLVAGFLFLGAYVVGLYVIGGAVGAYVKREGLLEDL